MATQYRQFSPEFTAFMGCECAWPDAKTFARSLRRDGHGYRNDAYSRMRCGMGARHHYFTGFVELLTHPAVPEHLLRSQSSLLTFIGESRTQGASRSSAAEIVKRISRPCLAEAPSEAGLRDWLSLGLEGLLGLFGTKRAAARHIQRCSSDDLLREAVEWVYVEAGNLNAPRRLSPKEAIAAHERDLSLPIGEFEEFCRQCLRRHEWTMLLARGQRKPTGVSVMLPLRADTYARIRSGKLASFKTRPADYVIPSRHLFFEALIDRPAECGGEEIEAASRSMFWCALAQFGVLSKLSIRGTEEPLRVLSFAAAPASRKRLEANGYVPIGVNMYGTNAALYERIFDPGAVGYDMLFIAVINLLNQVIDGPPPK